MKKNEVMVFENEELELQVRTLLNSDGSISVSAEDTAMGFGWYRIKNGKDYVMWDRFNGFCDELGFPHKCGKDDYIPESLYYLLGMKANNEKAQKYQRWLAIEVLPTLRKTGLYEMPKKEKSTSPKRLPLSSVNMMVKNVMSTLEKAKVEPVFVAAEVKRLYTDLGYDVKAPLLTDKEKMPKLYDCTEIAKELAIYSTSGNQHNRAVGAIIKKLHIPESEIVTTAFSKNGHEDVTIQYKPSVLEDVKLWLAENNYPTKIPYVDSKGNSKTCTVAYKEVA